MHGSAMFARTLPRFLLVQSGNSTTLSQVRLRARGIDESTSPVHWRIFVDFAMLRA